MVHPIGLASGAESFARPPTPASVWQTWNWEPWLLLGSVGLACVYVYGLRRLWEQAGPGHGITCRQVVAFGGAWLALCVAFVSPLDALSAALFSAHMVQHELLMVVAVPLLAFSHPLVGGLRALPAGWRHAVGRWWGRSTGVRPVWGAISTPGAAWLLHAAVLWGWHTPVLYQAALENQLIHLVKHVCFLGSALVFWGALIRRRNSRVGYGTAIVSIFTTMIHSSILGALLTFTRAPWYPAYLETTSAWGLSPMEDQQLAGLIMWVPAGLIYVAAGLIFLAVWLAESERRVRLHEVPRPAHGSR